MVMEGKENSLRFWIYNFHLQRGITTVLTLKKRSQNTHRLPLSNACIQNNVDSSANNKKTFSPLTLVPSEFRGFSRAEKTL